MKLIIRADSNKTVAMGHVMRCLSIADAVRDAGGEVVFVTASNDPEALITARGYRCIVMDTDFADTFGELPKLKAVIGKERPDVILFDGYYFKNEYFKALEGMAKLVFVDDYGKWAFPVDMVVNYNIYGEDLDYEGVYAGEGKALPKLLRGTVYAPLRREFLNAAPVKIKEGTLKVLVSTGGADLCRVALSLCERLLADRPENISLGVLVGPFSQDRDAIKRLSAENPDFIRVYENITDMSGFLSRFDMALSAAGSTSYELCRMGIPTCLFCTADNQSLINETFKKKGITESAGNAERDKNAVLDRLVVFIKEYTDAGKRASMAEKMRAAVDARGAERIASEIFKI